MHTEIHGTTEAVSENNDSWHTWPPSAPLPPCELQRTFGEHGQIYVFANMRGPANNRKQLDPQLMTPNVNKCQPVPRALIC